MLEERAYLEERQHARAATKRGRVQIECAAAQARAACGHAHRPLIYAITNGPGAERAIG